MIRQRFILVIVCSALSSLVTDNSLAIAWESELNSISVTAPLNRHRRVSISNDAKLIGQNVRQSEPTLEEDASTTAPEKIDRNSSLMAMAVTSIIALFLLWLLFRPQKATQASIVDRDNRSKVEEVEGETLLDSANSPDTKAEIESAKLVTLELDNSASIEWLAQRYRSKMKTGAIAEPTADIDPVVELIKDLQHSDRQIRRKAIWELAEQGDPRSIQPLVNIMPAVSSLDKSLISNAITQIVHRSFQPIEQRLFGNLRDRDPQIRKNAIHDLSDIYLFIAPVGKQLARMQLDEDPEVSQAAVRALHQLSLGSHFKSERGDVRHARNHAPKTADTRLRLVRDPVAELDAEP